MFTYLSSLIRSKIGKAVTGAFVVSVMSALFYFLPPDVQKQFLKRQGSPELTNLAVETCVVDETRHGSFTLHCSRKPG